MNAEEKPIPSILIVDDDEVFVDSLRDLLTLLPARVEAAFWGDQAMNLILDKDQQNDPFKLIILDMWVSRTRDGDIDQQLGENFLSHYQLVPPGTPIIVFTNNQSYDSCVACMKDGAYYYLPKMQPGRNNHDFLFERCHEVLYPERRPDPLQEWLDQHVDYLISKFAGMCVGFVEIETAKEAGLLEQEADPAYEVIEGYVVIPKENQAELGRMMLKNPILRWKEPTFREFLRV